MKKGYLVFNGGEAFSPTNRSADRAWLKLIHDQHRPRLIVVPVAAMRHHQRVAYQTVRYFKRLSTFSEYKLITDWRTANTSAECEILNNVEAIVLPDGSPIDMVERVRGTRTEAALHQALERKAAVMATGASAMALGAVYWFTNEWEPGLGLAPHLAILPQHDLVRMRLSPARLLADLPQGVTLIGVDQSTNLICHPDDSYQVAGQGTVTVYRSVEAQDQYRAEDRFRLMETEG